MTERARARATQCIAALEAAVTGDTTRVDQVIRQIAADGRDAMFAATCCFAFAMITATGHRPCPRNTVGVQVIDLTTGTTVSLDQAGLDPETVAAFQIITTVGNADIATAQAVFNTAASAGHGEDTAAAVLALAAQAFHQGSAFSRDWPGGR